MANPLAEVGSSLFGNLFGGAMWIVLLLILIGIIGSALWYFLVYRKKFDMLVKITSERSSDPKIFFDKGAILTDRKTKEKFFRLLSSKVDLPAPPFKIVENTNRGDYLEIRRTSEEGFSFLTQPRIEKDRIIKSNGRIYPVSNQKQTPLETDISWVIKRKEQNRKLIKPESFLLKLLEWTPQLVSGFFMLIILWIFMNKLPGLIDALTELAQSLSSTKAAVTVG